MVENRERRGGEAESRQMKAARGREGWREAQAAAAAAAASKRRSGDVNIWPYVILCLYKQLRKNRSIFLQELISLKLSLHDSSSFLPFISVSPSSGVICLFFFTFFCLFIKKNNAVWGGREPPQKSCDEKNFLLLLTTHRESSWISGHYYQ